MKRCNSIRLERHTSQPNRSTYANRAMRLLRGTVAAFLTSGAHPFLLASLLSRRMSRKPEDGPEATCCGRSVNGERVGDRLAAARTLSRLRRTSPSATHHGRFAHVRPSGPPPTSKWLVTDS